MRRLRFPVLALLLAGCATTKTATRERPRHPPPDQPTTACYVAGGVATAATYFLLWKYGTDDGDVYPSPARYR